MVKGQSGQESSADEDIETSARIPVAKDPSGNLVHIGDARRKRRYYKCVKCDGLLVPRHGPIREWHYAHYEGEGAGCPLRSVQGVIDLVESLKQHTRDQARRSKVARLGLRLHPYRPAATCLALLPTLTTEELTHLFESGGTLESITVKGALSPPPGESFRPDNSWVDIEIPAFTSERYLEVGCQVPLEARLIGRWKAPKAKDGHIFAIQGKMAVEVPPQKTDVGDEVIMIHPPEGLQTEQPAYWVDSVPLYRLVIDENTRSHLTGTGEDSRRLRTRIVFPWDAEPLGNEPIRPSPDKDVLILAQVREGNGEEIEIVASPQDDRISLELLRSPEGPLAIKVPAARDSVLQLSVHFRLESEHFEILPPRSPGQFEEISPVVFECLSIEDRVRVTPWGGESHVRLLPGPKDAASLDAWGIQAMRMPDGIAVEKISAEYEGGFTAITRPGFTDASTVEDILHRMLAHGPIERISIDFGPLGDVVFTWELGESRRMVFSEEEIVRQLVEYKGSIPKKIRWRFALDLLGLDEGFPHRRLAGGTLKKIRRAVKAMSDAEENGLDAV